MNPTIHSHIFGDGVIRNANIPHSRFAEFNNPLKPRLWLFHDGTYNIGGRGGSGYYTGTVGELDELANEIRRIAAEVGA